MRDIEKIKAIEAELGPRNESAEIDSRNRSAVKKWLRALGIPAAKTEKMKLATLRKCYQYPSYMNAVLRADDLEPYNSDVEVLGFDESEFETAETETETETTETKQEAKPVKNNDKLALLAQLLESDTPEIDMDEVRRVAGEEARKVAVSTEVVVTLPDNTKREVKGAHHELLPEIIKILGMNENVFLVGPAGSGKTTTCMKAAEALGRDFYFTGSVSSEHKLIGWMDANGNTVRTPFREAFENGGVFLFDEVDASHPAALLALNAALDNRICAFPDATIEAHDDFVAIAAGNTWGTGANAEYCGRNRLDGASLQRFIQIQFGYDEKLEMAVSSNADWTRTVQSFRAAKDELGVRTIVSPRQSIKGGKLLSAGFAEKRVKELLLGPELDGPTLKKVWGLAAEIKSREEVIAA